MTNLIVAFELEGLVVTLGWVHMLSSFEVALGLAWELVLWLYWFGTCTGGFCSCIGSGMCAGGFCGCSGSRTCAGGFGMCAGRFGGSGVFGICTGSFGSGGWSGMCSEGPVSGGHCGLGGAWFCAWSIGTTTTCGSSGGFCFGGVFC